MGFKDKIMEKAAGHFGENMVKDIQKAQKDSNDLVKQLNSELHELAELINQVLDSQNEIIKGNVSVYKLLKLVAEKQGIDVPFPLTPMEID